MPQPRKYEVAKCIRSCTLNERRLPGQTYRSIHEWYEAGNNDPTIVKKAAVLDIKLSQSAVARHRANHLVPVDQLVDLDPVPDFTNGQKLSDIEVVERIIAAGSSQLAIRGIKISPEMTLRAIEMKYKLTQGSVFEGFLSAIGAVNEAAIKEDELQTGIENEEAVASSDEQVQVAADVSGI